MTPVVVQRVGTQVVVRLAGCIGQARADELAAAVNEVETLVISRVVIDLDEVTTLDQTGLDFVTELCGRWRVRFVNTPLELRSQLPLRPAS